MCWEIIKVDLLEVVHSFFCGSNMPKFMTHACLVLLPNKLNEFKPISLSNFSNKIISKLSCRRLTPILSRIISSNQQALSEAGVFQRTLC